MQATQVDIDFKTGPDRSPQADHILAAGGARLNVHTIYTKTPPEDTTVQGDQLFATLVDGETLSSLRGTGHTSLVTVNPNGITQSSKGDNLLLTFAPSHPTAKPEEKGSKAKPDAPAPQPAAQLQSAVQLGNVTLVQQGAANPDGPTPPATTATAQRAAYDAATQVVQLSGSPRMQETSGELSANLIEVVAEQRKCRCDGRRESHLSPNEWPAEYGVYRVWARCTWLPITPISSTPPI